MRIGLRWVLAMTLLLPTQAWAHCADLLPRALPQARLQRSIVPTDLARLRDIGRPDGALLGGMSPLAISPDQARVAFVISRADPKANAYCVGLAVMDLRSGSRPHLIDQGGEMILASGNVRGLITPTGYVATVTPAWSPDGRWIAYLRRDRGVTQLWMARAEGGMARQLSDSPVDVEQLVWRADGSAVLFSSRTGQVAERAADAALALTGYPYGDRFVPAMSSVPLPVATTPLSAYAVDIASLAIRPVAGEERTLLPPDALNDPAPLPAARADDGRRAWTAHSTDNLLSPLVLQANMASGQPIACTAGACRGKYTGLWWMPKGGPLLFMRREGWDLGDLVLYRWQPGSRQPRAVLRTSGVIDGCVVAHAQLVCLRESATVPRHIVRIDPQTGRTESLYDPNPEFSAIRFGDVERLYWRNDRGLKVRGDLVLPPDHKPGTRLPLIITTYWSSGFLRGATGNEYPIHAFAARGFAVLSLHRPPFVAEADATVIDADRLNTVNAANWAERRSLHSAVLVGMQRVIDMGVADPDRIGITGLSDGSSTVGFALINSRRFAAAAVSTCCLEPWMVNATFGPAFARTMRKQGWPAATADDRQFWAPGSLIQNAASIDTPLLMQLADREYLTAIDVYAALREQGKPVDMYVFPDEYHNKWQPAHRLAIYDRNLDWFDYWLNDRIDPDPRKADQYALWRSLRKQHRKARDD
ncbi:Atxe2 family lasso peptide isopeptidase [Sphingobium limneticum]|nr:Atxe2 family lasso peptide isopeptidase [Sphingobium limneticum]